MQNLDNVDHVDLRTSLIERKGVHRAVSGVEGHPGIGFPLMPDDSADLAGESEPSTGTLEGRIPANSPRAGGGGLFSGKGAIDAHGHVRLARADPDFPDEDVFDGDRCSATVPCGDYPSPVSLSPLLSEDISSNQWFRKNFFSSGNSVSASPMRGRRVVDICRVTMTKMRAQRRR